MLTRIDENNRQGPQDPASNVHPAGHLSRSIEVPTTFRSPLSCQFLQQDLGLFEVRGVEPLGEPAVDLR